MYKIKDHLEVSNDHLTIGGCDSVDLVKQYGSPLFVINENRIRDNLKRYRDAFPDADMYYAAKANGNLAIMRVLALEGAGADVFSGGELYLAILAGIERKKILFNGNSKTDAELTMAIETGVRVSVDSIDELRTLAALARGMGKTIDVAFRVNPDVSATTHPKIATGLKSAKFGIPHEEVVEVYKEARDLDGVNPVGIHCHIGSQILDVTPFGHSTSRMMDLVEKVAALGIDIEFVDIGSGLGIPYEKGEEVPTPKDLANVVLPVFNERCAALGISPKLVLEPGRYIVGDAVVLLTTANTMKAAAKNFVGIDAGFNLLIRPAMYDSYHYVVVANKASQKPAETYTIAGPICETGDIIAHDRELPIIEKGDTIAILDTGAYGFSMASQYNGRPRCAEVLIKEGVAELVRKAEGIDDLLANQIMPARLL